MITYEIQPKLSDYRLNTLFGSAWKNYKARRFFMRLQHSLTYVCAFDAVRLVGFVNVAWDGGAHGFVLDTTVHRDYQRRGIGTELLQRAALVAAQRGVEWLHVDYEPHLESFYRNSGYIRTKAGVLNLRSDARAVPIRRARGCA